MFVKNLRISNWRSHRASELLFGPVNLIRGPNASGKSSVAQALEFLLTGRCLGTDEAGRGGDALVRTGARAAVVEGLLVKDASPSAVTQGLTLSRERSAAGSNCTLKMEGRTYVGRQVEEFLSKWNWSKAGLSCVLRAGRFIELPASEQKELLAEVLEPEPLAVPPDMLEAMRDLAEDILPTWSGYVGLGKVDLDGLRAIEKDAVQARANGTATLRELGDPSEPPPRPKATTEQIREKLDALRSEQAALVARKEKLENEWTEKSKRQRELPKLITFWADKILSEDGEKRNMETVANEQKITIRRKEEASLDTYIAQLGIEIEEMENHPGICPTCQRPLDLREKLTAAKTRRGEFAQKLSQLRSFLEGCADVGDAKVQLAAHRNAILEKAKLEKELKEFKLGEPPKTSKLTEQIEALEARVQKGQEVLADTARVQANCEAFQELIEKRKALEARRTAADMLAKWAGPNGAQAQMTAGKLPAFIAQVNQTLEAFGYRCEIELEPYSIRARRMGGEASLELGSLSESEKWRFSLGFQAALAVVTGIRCIVLDGADILSKENRATLMKVVLDLGLDQIILLATAEATPLHIPGLTIFDLEISGGKTVCHINSISQESKSAVG